MEHLKIKGKFEIKCFDKDGVIKWIDHIDNTVATVGKNLALDTILAGSAYTVTGPFMGLVSSVSYSAISVADTMASHAGWLEAGNAHAPTYTGSRPTCAFSAASAGTKSLSSVTSYTMSGGGTVKGCFVVYGSGAVNTVDNTSGTLLSIGLFSGGDRLVQSGDIITVNYSLSL